MLIKGTRLPPSDAKSRTGMPKLLNVLNEFVMAWVSACIVIFTPFSYTYRLAGTMQIGQRLLGEWDNTGEVSLLHRRNIHESFKQSISSPRFQDIAF